MTFRIGYCCKWMEPNFSKPHTKTVEEMNMRGTTITHLKTLSKEDQIIKITDIVKHNIQAVKYQLLWVSEQPKEMRMVRIGSDFLPAATHVDFLWAYNQTGINGLLQKGLSELGELARIHDIRLTMHPGQFTILNSLKEDVITRAIEDLEYHTKIAILMGYGQTWHSHGMAINIHAGPKAGSLKTLTDVINNRLSPEARNLITIENDEFSWGLDDLISIADQVALVFDLHHHFIKTGEHIRSDDQRLLRVRDSWRGIRPVGHLSTSPEIISPAAGQTFPDLEQLLKAGFKRNILRTHSDLCWNRAVNENAQAHLEWMDIEVEAKHKNIASRQLYDFVKA